MTRRYTGRLMEDRVTLIRFVHETLSSGGKSCCSLTGTEDNFTKGNMFYFQTEKEDRELFLHLSLFSLEIKREAARVAQRFSTAFSPRCDPGDPESSPTLVSLHGACFFLCLCLYLSLSLCVSHELKKKKKKKAELSSKVVVLFFFPAQSK